MVCLGGSHAQREVIKDTLLVALMRSGQTARAQAVLDERLHRRPSLRDALAGEHRALSRGVSRRGWRVSPLRTVPHLRPELLDPLAKNRAKSCLDSRARPVSRSCRPCLFRTPAAARGVPIRGTCARMRVLSSSDISGETRSSLSTFIVSRPVKSWKQPAGITPSGAWRRAGNA